MTKCEICGNEMVTKGKGRPKRFCSQTCKQKNFKLKAKAATPEYKEGGLYRFENGVFVETQADRAWAKEKFDYWTSPEMEGKFQEYIKNYYPDKVGVPTLDLQEGAKPVTVNITKDHLPKKYPSKDDTFIFAPTGEKMDAEDLPNGDLKLTLKHELENAPKIANVSEEEVKIYIENLQPSPEPTTAPTETLKPKVEEASTKKKSAKIEPKKPVETKPERLKGESGIEYRIRLSELAEKSKNP